MANDIDAETLAKVYQSLVDRLAMNSGKSKSDMSNCECGQKLILARSGLVCGDLSCRKMKIIPLGEDGRDTFRWMNPNQSNVYEDDELQDDDGSELEEYEHDDCE